MLPRPRLHSWSSVLTLWKGIKHLEGESKMQTAPLGWGPGWEGKHIQGLRTYSGSSCPPCLQRVEEAGGQETFCLGPGNVPQRRGQGEQEEHGALGLWGC